MAQGMNAAVIKAITILDYFGSHLRGQRLQDIARAVDLPESTTHRLLNSLAAKGYVRQDTRSQAYSLGWKIAALASAANRETQLIDTARPYLQRLAGQFNCSVNLAVLEQDQVLYLDCILPAQSVVSLYTAPGTFFPVHATALGKALLAHLAPSELNAALSRLVLKPYTPSTIVDAERLCAELETVRQRGFAIDRAEYVPGVHCVAAPIRDASLLAVAAISVSGRSTQLTPDREQATARLLVDTCGSLSQTLFGPLDAVIPQED